MSSDLLVRLRPTTPWRFGSDAGPAEPGDGLYHSDSLYGALCAAFGHLGQLDEWLEATARAAEPAVRLSSCFPWQHDTLFVPPPRNLWPQAQSTPPLSSKVRWKSARYVPVSVVQSLLRQETLSDDGWIVDGESGCLLPIRGGSATGPFRYLRRFSAPVDRITGVSGEPSITAVAQFSQSSGLWFAASFASDDAEETWSPRLEAALRLLADSGFGGLRSRGFGRCAAPEFRKDRLASLILPESVPGSDASPHGWWLLSLFTPAETDQIDWTDGDYRFVTRGGRVESPAAWGRAKKELKMVTEGSVLIAPSAPRGAASDVAPDGFPHPVYRAGYALAVPISWRAAG
jgi:CRISPR type III-A-associated RAMP protein Csm4